MVVSCTLLDDLSRRLSAVTAGMGQRFYAASVRDHELRCLQEMVDNSLGRPARAQTKIVAAVREVSHSVLERETEKHHFVLCVVLVTATHTHDIVLFSVAGCGTG